MYWFFLVSRCFDQWFDVCDFFGCSLVLGDVEGNLDKLFGRVNIIQKKSGSFDVGFILLFIYFCFYVIKKGKNKYNF